MTILDQFGRPIRTVKAPEKRTLAAAPILDSWREYVTIGLTPQRLTTLLKEADSGNVQRQAELFDQMEEKDAHLLGEAEKRRNAILDIEFTVKPASEDSRDVKVAEFVQEYFDNSTDWDDTIVSMQDSVGKGFSALEILWDVSSGQAMPNKLEFIEQKRFIFTDATGYLRKYPKLLSDDNMMGDEIPAWKMLFHRYGGKAGHAARSGIYRVCAWMFLFRNYALKDWMIFLEVFGMPLRLGKYDAGAEKEDKDDLIAAIQSLGSDAAGIISKNTEIEFIEAVKSGTKGDNPYLAMAQFCGKEMSKALLGQTLTADVGDTGSYAAANTHNEVRLDLAKADTRAVAATTRYQLIRPMVGFNFGWDTPVPGYAAVWQEREDLKSLSEVYKNVIGFGQPVAAEHVSNKFGIPLPQKGESVLTPTKSLAALKYTAKGGATGPEIDDLSPTHTLDRLGEKALSDADADLYETMAPVRELLLSVNSLAEFKERLLDVYEDMDASAVGDLIQRALVLADLSGRFDAQER